MVLEKLLSSLWSSNDSEKKNETQQEENVNFPQGAQLLRYRQERIQKLDKQANMLIDPNGYSQTETLRDF